MATGRLRAVCFAWLNRGALRLVRGLDVLHQGFWLGLMDAEALNRATGLWYARLGRQAEVEYLRSGLFAWEEEAIATHFAGCRTLLVGAAGGGREVLALSRRGCEIESFDCSEATVAACRRFLSDEGVGGTVHLAPPGGVPPGLGIYDGVIVGWGAYMHIPGRARRVAFLRALRRHLHPGAPVLLSFFAREGNPRRHRVIASVATFVRRARGSHDAPEIGDTIPGTFDHLFSREEIERELAEAGLDPVHAALSPYPHAVGRVRTPSGPAPAPAGPGGPARER